MALVPEYAIALDGVDSATQAGLVSDEEDFYGSNSSEKSDISEDEDSDSEVLNYSPNMSQDDLQARAKIASTRRVSRTELGSAEGVYVPSSDPLYEEVSKTLSESCCEDNCLSLFDVSEVYQFLLNLLEMSKEQKSMLLLGKLHILSRAGEPINHARKKGGKRQRVTYNYAFDHREVCKKAFLFLHNIGEKQFKNMVKHLRENGPIPIVHGNVGKLPSTVYPFQVVVDVVQYIKKICRNTWTAPQPSARSGRADIPPIYLPASQNFKIVHDHYVKAVMDQDPSQRVMQYRSFVDVWYKCVPEIQFMTPRTDVCSICQGYRNKIKEAISEQDKLTLTSAFSDHLHQAQRECQYYLDCCRRDVLPTVSPGAAHTCMYAHYTFDFAEQLHLPHHSRQVGPMYFKVGRRVQLFGICCDTNKIQVNCLIDESESIGQNGTKTHGPNSVISMLDHYFATHGLNELICHCHADNCVGQNKNRFVLGYLSWHVITGKNREINLSFMEVGHTRCLVDGHFGLI